MSEETEFRKRPDYEHCRHCGSKHLYLRLTCATCGLTCEHLVLKMQDGVPYGET